MDMMLSGAHKPGSESAPMLAAPWGPLADKVAQLIRHDQHLARRLLLAPIRAFHAYAAFLQLAAPASDPELRRQLLEDRPRDLLDRAIPQGGSTLWRCLSLAGHVALSADGYRRLAALANGPCAGALCTGGPLTVERIEFLECVAGLDPLVAASPIIDTGDIRLAGQLGAALEFLRAIGGLEDDGTARLALQRTRPPNIADFVHRRLLKLATPREIVGTELLREVRTGAELRDLGRRFVNCLASETQFLIQLAVGSRRFFEWTSEPGAVISLGAAPNGFHWIEQIRRFGNGMVDEETRRRIRQELATVGIRLLSGDPFDTLGNLLDGQDADDLDAQIQEALNERQPAAQAE